MHVFLDTGQLGLVTNPNKPPEAAAAIQWAVDMEEAGHVLIVPAIADYEVRRELLRLNKRRSTALLDAWNSAAPDRYLEVTDSALRLAATFWAQSRNAGLPTSDIRELDCDVLIAAQAVDYGLPQTDFVIATTNVRHLSRFAPAKTWRDIYP